MFRHIDLFSGIGGFSLAAQWVWGKEHDVVCFCEKDEFCQKILNKHWPNVPIVEDIEDVEGIKTYTKKNKAAISLLTGGFPCQSFSVAGKQRGKDDDRYLWPGMLEIIKRTQPRWIIGENVAGIIKLALDTVLSDLEAEGYTTRTFIIPACAKNAPHRRDRVWIVANAGLQRQAEYGKQAARFEQPGQDVADTKTIHAQGQPHGQGQGELGGRGWRQSQRRLGEPTARLPKRLDNPWGEGWEDGTPRVITGQKDRVNRLKALGNSIVPQVAYEIMMAIKEVEED